MSFFARDNLADKRSIIRIKVSRQGTPSEPQKRSVLSQLCAFNFIFVTFLRLATVAFGVLAQVAVEYLCTCESKHDGASIIAMTGLGNVTSSMLRNSSCSNEEHVEIVRLFRGLFVTHVMEAASAAFFYVWRFFDILRPLARIVQRNRDLTSPVTRTGCCNWTIFCRMCCTCTSLLTCCLFGGLDAATADFVDLSTAMEDFFDSDGSLDVTISDILAGILMVHAEQMEEREECRKLFRSIGGHSRSQQISAAMASMKQQAAHFTSEEFEIMSDDLPEQPWRGRLLVSDANDHPDEQEVVVEERLKVFYTMILRRHRSSTERVFEPKPRFILDPLIQEDRTAILEGGK